MVAASGCLRLRESRSRGLGRVLFASPIVPHDAAADQIPKKQTFSVGKAHLLAPSHLSTYFTLTFVRGDTPMFTSHVLNRTKKHEAVLRI